MSTATHKSHVVIGCRHNREVYKTALLPGFELPLGKLLAVCDTWKK